MLGSGLFIAFTKYITEKIFEYTKSISAVPSKTNKPVTVMMWIFIGVYIFLGSMFLPLIIELLTLKSSFWKYLTLILIILMIVLIGITPYLILTSLKETNYIVPKSEFKFATFIATLPDQSLVKLWIIKELDNGNLLCVSGLSAFNNEHYIYIPKEQLNFKEITYTLLSDKDMKDN